MKRRSIEFCGNIGTEAGGHCSVHMANRIFDKIKIFNFEVCAAGTHCVHDRRGEIACDGAGSQNAGVDAKDLHVRLAMVDV